MGLVKRRVADKNVQQSPKDIERLTRESFETVSTDERQICRHVDNLRADYWTRDGLLENEIDKLIIHVGSDNDSESDEERYSSDSSFCSVISGVHEIVSE